MLLSFPALLRTGTPAWRWDPAASTTRGDTAGDLWSRVINGDGVWALFPQGNCRPQRVPGGELLALRLAAVTKCPLAAACDLLSPACSLPALLTPGHFVLGWTGTPGTSQGTTVSMETVVVTMETPSSAQVMLKHWGSGKGTVPPDPTEVRAWPRPWGNPQNPRKHCSREAETPHISSSFLLGNVVFQQDW